MILELLQKQRELDNFVLETKGLTISPSSLYTKRVVAFFVELGEFTNELRSFKFWSNKKPSPKEVLLEEYVDALHFLLSITYTLQDTSDAGNSYITDRLAPAIDSYLATKVHFAKYEDIGVKLADDFILKVVSHISDISYVMPLFWRENLLMAWLDFIYLGLMVGFTRDDIIEAYNKKYEVNIERQRQGY
jgi:dimeric dUTPase (all-alpha-NTP-PPase superfamily)